MSKSVSDLQHQSFEVSDRPQDPA